VDCSTGSPMVVVLLFAIWDDEERAAGDPAIVVVGDAWVKAAPDRVLEVLLGDSGRCKVPGWRAKIFLGESSLLWCQLR
jgi:hypothetical protein